jgi:hypothetical protein
MVRLYSGVVLILIILFVAPLYNHLQHQGIEFIQFAFRWMNCLLMREIPLKNTIRMWDSYQVNIINV